MKKRLLAAIMSLCMIVSLLPVSALAAPDGYDNTFNLEVGEEDWIYGSGDILGWNHNWTVNDEDVVSVYPNDSTAKIVARSEGETVIIHSYTTGVPYIYTEEHTERYHVAVTDGAPSQSDKDAYFYVVDPTVATSAIEGRDTELFEYVGKGSVGGSIPAANHPSVNEQTFPISAAESKGWTNTPPENLLDITYNGTPYKYWDDNTEGTPPDHYYTVTWYRYSSSNGYTDENGTSHGNVGMCWHLDGYVELNDMVQVRFMVNFPDKGFTYVNAKGEQGTEANIWYVKEDSYFNDILNPPDMETNAPKGYVFKGWYTDEACTTPVDKNSPFIDKDMIFYGEYEKVMPTEPILSVEKNVKLLKDSTASEIQSGQKVDVGDTLQYTVTVTNSGATAEASTVVVRDSKFPEDKNNVTVTSSSGTETVVWSGISATITSELAKDESVTFTYTYPVTNQDQVGGSVSNTADVALNGTQQDTTTISVPVKAKTYSLTYNANGGTFEGDKETFVVNDLTSGSEYTLGEEADYKKPTHAQANLNGETVNVAFIGWTLSNNNKHIYSVDQNVPNSETSITIQTNDAANTVYAIWGYDTDSDHVADVLENTVTFDADGGTPEPETQYVQDGEKATKPADPAKAGFTFAEWYLEGATTPYDFSTPVTEDITLVAHWTDATQYTVTFDPNGGSLTSAPTVTVPPNTPVTKPADPVWNDDYIFMGWTTEPILGKTYGVGENLPGMVFQNSNTYTPTGTTILYAVWGEDSNHDDVADVYEVFIAPADITIYTGGTGYEGVSDGAGNEIENSNSGLPEPGFHIILPADLGLGDGNVLNGIVKFQYYGWDDITDNTVRREWDLSCVGVYSAELGQFVYSLESTGDTPAVRVTYTGENGEAVEHDRIDMSANAASAKYDMSINTGGLTPSAIQAVITTADGTPETRSLVIGTGELTIRSTVDRTDNTNTIADNAGEVSDGSFNAVGNNASYVVNDSEVPVPTEGDRVQLLVDQVSDSAEFNNAMGEAALDHPQVNGTAFETAYLDLVDTQNGNTVVTLNTGSMDIYWPMPSNADPSGTFQVVHYYNMNRETTVDDTALDTQASEVLTGTPEYRNGDWYVRFTTHSFSPFVLVYEEDTSRPVNPNPGGGSGGDSDSDPTGNLSIELDVNGGDDEFTFTVILTDKDGDDLENNFYYNGDYTGTIGSGDEITLEGGDKIVIRNLPEGTRYEVIIETADGYTYVIDGEEGVIHTGMNEAEFTATRTVPVADPSVTGVSRWLNTTDHIAYLTGYPGGAFGPDNNMTRAEVAQMFYALLNNKNVTITKTFPDVPADAWYAAAVNTLASLGMVSGDENGNYRPNDPITRAEFCVIALAFAYEPENAVCYFGDVSRSDWFYTYVAQAASYGWIGGYTNGNFGPNDRITRAQVTTIVNNMLGRAADRDYVIDHQADLVQFTDLTRAHWGYFQIMEATNAHDYTKSNGTENWR